MRVLVVDDEKPCLDELVYMLSKQENVEIAGAFTSPLKALEASADLNPVAAFLDLSMPHLNGSELAREMLARGPGLKVVFVTAYAKELAGLKEIYTTVALQTGWLDVSGKRYCFDKDNVMAAYRKKEVI